MSKKNTFSSAIILSVVCLTLASCSKSQEQDKKTQTLSNQSIAGPSTKMQRNENTEDSDLVEAARILSSANRAVGTLARNDPAFYSANESDWKRYQANINSELESGTKVTKIMAINRYAKNVLQVCQLVPSQSCNDLDRMLNDWRWK